LEQLLDKAELLARIQTEYSRLQTTLAGLTAEQMLQPGVTGDWSVKDVLAHLTFWQKHSLEELQAALHNKPHLAFPSLEGEDWNTTLDRLNAENYQANRERPLAEVRTEFEESYRQILEILNTLSEDDFEPGSPLEQALEGEPVSSAVGSNTWEHYAEHRKILLISKD
jgi:hypothetical protein